MNGKRRPATDRRPDNYTTAPSVPPRANDTEHPGLFHVTRGAYGTVYSPTASADVVLDDVAERTDGWWATTCDAAIAELAHRGRPFEAWDLVALGVPEPEHPSRWGARLRAAAKAGLIEPAGAGPSSRPTVRGSLVRRWRGVR